MVNNVYCLVAICVLVTLFSRYADLERFPTSAYLNIGLTYLLSLSSIGLLGLDLAYTIRDRQDGIESKIYETETAVLWNIVYWGSLITGTVFSNFLTRYWQCGHFTMGRRIKYVLKTLLKLIIAGAIVFGALAVLILGWLQPQLDGLKSIALIMSSIYNMLVLVVLMAYGLFNLPIYLWKCQDNKESLYAELQTAE